MSLVLIFKLVVVLIFLIQFLRRPSLPWGIGLLTVTSTLLLDTIFGTFNADQLRSELGFFFYVIIGFLLGGAAYWLLGLLWPTLKKGQAQPAETAVAETQPADSSPTFGQITDENGVVYDLQLIYEDLNTNFNQEDLLDLIFDLNIPQAALGNANGSQSMLAADIVQYAEENNQGTQLALAVERIANPPAPETLPRLAKITPDSPRPILRYYLLAHFELAQLQETAAALQIDWSELEGAEKRGKTRALLQAVYQQKQVPQLLDYLQANPVETSDS